MKFIHSRRIRFADTDAAGVVYFANYLSICHEAYEEALVAAGIELNRYFGDEGIIIPVSHARSDYLRSLQCGNTVEVEVAPELVKEDTFTINYKIFLTAPVRKLAAQVRTDHVCLDSATRRRRPLPERFAAWVHSVPDQR